MYGKDQLHSLYSPDRVTMHKTLLHLNFVTQFDFLGEHAEIDDEYRLYEYPVGDC